MRTVTVQWNRVPGASSAGLLAILLLPAGGRLVAEEEGKKEAAGAEAPKDTPGKAAPAEGAASLPEGVLARLNGRDIRVDEYASYLLASLGRSKLDEYIDRLLVEEEAKRLSVTVPAETVEASVLERIDRIIKSVYKGQEEAYLANLARRRSSLEEEKAKLRQERYYDLLRDQVILKTRRVTEEDIQREFEEVYGEGGVRHTLRHILIASGLPAAGAPTTQPGAPTTQPGAPTTQPGAPTTQPGAPTTLPQGAPAEGAPPPPGRRTRAEARERAEAVLKELQAGGDFSRAVTQYSDDPLTRRNEGRIPVYRKEYFGEDFHRAVVQLSPESPLSGIVESPRGYHIVQLVEKKVTRLEDVRAGLESAVRAKPPTARERLDLVARLREGAKIEGL